MISNFTGNNFIFGHDDVGYTNQPLGDKLGICRETSIGISWSDPDYWKGSVGIGQ